MAGKLFAFGAQEPFRHRKVWMRERTTGPDRLRIGGGDNSVSVLEDLAGLLAEPLFVLVVLSVPRTGAAAGRYESDALTRAELAGFLDEFEELFTSDARAGLWVGSTTGDGLLVLDEHDLLYAYGDLDAVAERLGAGGFRAGEPAAPDPHEHHYNKEYDELEAGIVARNWRRVMPLEEDDE